MDYQNWSRLHNYSQDYFDLVYNTYLNHIQVSELCSYYKIDIQNSNIDKTILYGGAYELSGDLSGYRWQKILYLPIFYTQKIENSKTADENGVNYNNLTSSFGIPSCYDFNPLELDFVHFEYPKLDRNQKEDKNYNYMYQIVHTEKDLVTNVAFNKINIKVSRISYNEIENQVSSRYIFFDYEKRIYPIEVSQNLLFSMLSEKSLTNINHQFNKQTGFYFGI